MDDAARAPIIFTALERELARLTLLTHRPLKRALIKAVHKAVHAREGISVSAPCRPEAFGAGWVLSAKDC